MNFPIGFPEEEEKFRALGHHPSRYQLLVSTLKKRRDTVGQPMALVFIALIRTFGQE